MSRITAALKLAGLPVAKKIERARFIVDSMTSNPSFTSPSPALSVVTTAINDLEAARLKALAGGVDDTAEMHVKEELMELQLKLLLSYVIAIASANGSTAESVILSAGMKPVVRRGRVLSEASAETLNETGRIKVSVKYINRATFIFQMSTSAADEESWQTVYEGTRSKFIMSGLSPGTRYYFRASFIDKNGRGPWTDTMSAISL